jgi:hypothetical protein
MPDAHPIESFRLHPSADGYRVSDDGRVQCRLRRGPNPRGFTDWRELKPTLRSDGYLKVSMRIDGRQRQRLVHTLVAEAFLGPKPPANDVRHLDGDKTNNRLSNLAYGTRAENVADTRRHGRLKIGERHAGAKMDEAKVRELRRMRADGWSFGRLASRFGIAVVTAFNIATHRTWSHVT